MDHSNMVYIFFLIFNNLYDIINEFAGVAEWQTQQTQNLPGVTSCGFKSRHLHYSRNTGCIPVFFKTKERRYKDYVY